MCVYTRSGRNSRLSGTWTGQVSMAYLNMHHIPIHFVISWIYCINLRGCVYTYKYICTYIDTYICKYIYTCIHILIDIYAYVYTHIYVYVYIWYVCIFQRKSMYICIYVYMYVCIRPYMYIYVYIYTCKCIHTYKHTHAQETGEKPRLAGTWAEAILGLGQILAADPRSGVCVTLDTHMDQVDTLGRQPLSGPRLQLPLLVVLWVLERQLAEASALQCSKRGLLTKRLPEFPTPIMGLFYELLLRTPDPGCISLQMNTQIHIYVIILLSLAPTLFLVWVRCSHLDQQFFVHILKVLMLTPGFSVCTSLCKGL